MESETTSTHGGLQRRPRRNNPGCVCFLASHLLGQKIRVVLEPGGLILSNYVHERGNKGHCGVRVPVFP